jgi:hypothetical protein
VYATVRVQISRVPRNPYLLNKGDECHIIYKKTNTMVAVEQEGPLSRLALLRSIWLLLITYHGRGRLIISSHPISWSVNPSSCVKKNIYL